MNVWFGTSWDAPINYLTTHVATPVGATCLWCDEPIVLGDSGWGQGDGSHWMHVECFSRSLLGSVGHQLKLCSCHGGDIEDAEGLSKREAAQAAFVLMRELAQTKQEEP